MDKFTMRLPRKRWGLYSRKVNFYVYVQNNINAEIKISRIVVCLMKSWYICNAKINRTKE